MVAAVTRNFEVIIKTREILYQMYLDPVYTRVNDSGFVANPECFDIGFALPLETFALV